MGFIQKAFQNMGLAQNPPKVHIGPATNIVEDEKEKKRLQAQKLATISRQSLFGSGGEVQANNKGTLFGN
ncbi:MAG: hypothetical protein BWY74_02906 [Firmicutes bacterium ADurb.Bin419]|nr:MAG: hypothetical protein BWY74_02906 [Firmicutes bacterium ADurb.Bin419]